MLTKVKNKDFRGGFLHSNIGKKLKAIPKRLINTSERKTLYGTLAKRAGKGGLSKYETQGAIRELIDNKRDNISRQEAIRATKHLEKATGYKNLDWSSLSAQKYSRSNDPGSPLKHRPSSESFRRIMKAIKTKTSPKNTAKSPKKETSPPKTKDLILNVKAPFGQRLKASDPKAPNLTQKITSFFTKNNKSIAMNPKPAPASSPTEADSQNPPTKKEPPAGQNPPTTPITPVQAVPPSALPAQTATAAPKKPIPIKAEPTMASTVAKAKPAPTPPASPVKESLYSVNILVVDRQKSSRAVNDTLSEYGSLFLGRMGLPLSKKCTGQCSSVITLIAETSSEKIDEFRKKIEPVENVVTKITPLPQIETKKEL